MKFKLNRSHVLVTKEGPSYGFEPGLTLEVQARHADLALSIGAECVDPVDAVKADAAYAAAQAEKEAAEKRPAEILAAVQMILENNDTSDFTAGGRPKTQRVSAVVGFPVTNKDVDEAMLAVTTKD